MQAVLYDIHASLQKWGSHKWLRNLHGDPDHGAAIWEAIREIREGLGMEASAFAASLHLVVLD